MDTLKHVTFGLAYAAYLMLCLQTLLQLQGRGTRLMSFLLAATATAHVALVWHGSFHWSLRHAWTGSPAGFLIFHSALALIIASTCTPAPWNARCTLFAWPIVTVGALGAVLQREVVAHYLWPVAIACAITLVCGAGLTWRSKRQAEAVNGGLPS